MFSKKRMVSNFLKNRASSFLHILQPGKSFLSLLHLKPFFSNQISYDVAKFCAAISFSFGSDNYATFLHLCSHFTILSGARILWVTRIKGEKKRPVFEYLTFLVKGSSGKVHAYADDKTKPSASTTPRASCAES